ncbi:M60 family metallopeptidase [Nitratireductor sp. GCM10026969]|uniref:M60 family metallopeptidase n=1 Tax=Nitratireductor sp. GCM10026969 TaxID=3252645 RepID=UPI0036245A0C
MALGVLLMAVSTTAAAVEIPEGDYYIVAKHSYKALTAFEDSEGEIVLGQSDRKPDNDPTQLWTITRASNKTGGESYRIRSRQYGSYLAEGDENENGDISVVLEDKQSANRKNWRFEPYLNSYGIELGNSGTTLNVTGSDLADDAQIIVYDASTDDNAQWLLYPLRDRDETTALTSQRSQFDNLNKRYRLAPMPAATREANRLRRMKLMDYQPSGVFVEEGEAVSVTVEGLSSSPDGLTIMVGPMNSFWDEMPEDDPQLVTAEEGNTDFTAERDGLIYFLYADSGFNTTPLPPIEVEIANGGSSIPFYIEGQTTLDEWNAMLEERDAAPFVEMVSKHVAITVTREDYMTLDQSNPAETLHILEQILDWYDDVSGLDGSSELHRPSPLRLHYQQDTVTSPEVFEGGVYMYAGNYFVGFPGETIGDLLDPEELRHAWSIWHETGHKYQQWDWTWEDVVETTVNIYSLNAEAHFGELTRLQERDEDTGQTTLEQAEQYLARKTRDFDNAEQMRDGADDRRELWIRLVMFDQLRRGLGEEFYPRLHKYYREHPLDDDALENEAAQIQAFVLRSSMIADRDLTRFFTDWGVPIERETANRLKQLNLPPADPDLSRLELDD